MDLTVVRGSPALDSHPHLPAVPGDVLFSPSCCYLPEICLKEEEVKSSGGQGRLVCGEVGKIRPGFHLFDESPAP